MPNLVLTLSVRATIQIVLIVLIVSLLPEPIEAQSSPDDHPWWKEKKIVFMWGQWNYARMDKEVDYWIGKLPREHFRNVARAGGTVFAEAMGMDALLFTGAERLRAQLVERGLLAG